VYTFTDLQKITKDIIVQEEARLELSQKRDNNDLNLHRQESIVTAKDRDIRAIEKEVDSSKKQSSDGRDFKKEIFLFDLEKEIAHKERDLAELRIELYQKEIDLYDSKLLINQETIKAYKEHMLFIRSHIHI